MKEPRYLKFFKSTGSAVILSQGDWLLASENLNEDDWVDLLKDLIRQEPQMGVLLGLHPSDHKFEALGTLLNRTAPPVRLLISGAYSRILPHIFSSKCGSKEAERALNLPRLVDLPGAGRRLWRIVTNTSLSPEIRTLASVACLRYAKEGTLSWSSINLEEAPFLAPTLATYYADQSPEVAIRMISKFASSTNLKGYVEAATSALRQLSKQEGGLSKSKDLIATASPHAKKIFGEILKRAEFKQLNAILEETPQRDVASVLKRLGLLYSDRNVFQQKISEMRELWSHLGRGDQERAREEADRRLDDGVDVEPLDVFSAWNEILYVTSLEGFDTAIHLKDHRLFIVTTQLRRPHRARRIEVKL